MFNKKQTLIGSWEEDSAGGIIIFRENNKIDIMSTEEYGLLGIYDVNGNIINITLTIPIIEEEISWEMKYEFLYFNKIKFTYLNGESDVSIKFYQRV